LEIMAQLHGIVGLEAAFHVITILR